MQLIGEDVEQLRPPGTPLGHGRGMTRLSFVLEKFHNFYHVLIYMISRENHRMPNSEFA